MIGVWITFGIVVLLLLYGISIYNQLVSLLNRVQNAFSQIDVQLKRRYDLIPNLVEVAKKYMSHEEQTLLKVINARNAASSALQVLNTNGLDSAKVAEFSKAEGELTNALKGFNIMVEAYPDLKASQNLMQLNEEIASTENKIAFSRQAYNDSVMNYNTYKQSFPNVVIASMFARFQSDCGLLEFEEDRATLTTSPKVSFE